LAGSQGLTMLLEARLYHSNSRIQISMDAWTKVLCLPLQKFDGYSQPLHVSRYCSSHYYACSLLQSDALKSKVHKIKVKVKYVQYASKKGNTVSCTVQEHVPVQKVMLLNRIRMYW